MKRAILGVLLCSGCAAIWGCAPPRLSMERLNAPPRALKPRPAHSVAVFVTTRPDRPYVEVAILEAEEGTKGPKGGPGLVRMLREKAATVGCDGIMLAGWGSRIKVQGNTYDVSFFTRSTVRCTCIVYRPGGGVLPTRPASVDLPIRPEPPRPPPTTRPPQAKPAASSKPAIQD